MNSLRLWFGMMSLAALLLCQAALADTPYVQQIDRDGMPKDSVLFVSWNACNFGKSKSVETLAIMADILQDADIVALQEISTGESGAQAVAALADELNRKGAKWDYVLSNATVGPGTERFAYLFKTKKIWVNRDDNKLLVSLEDALDREPAAMLFHAGQKKFSVRNFHLQPNDVKNGKNPRKELESVKNDAQDFSQGPMIVAGDFNLSHFDMKTVFEDTFGFSHNIEGKTSLKMKYGKNGVFLNKEFDNIYTREVTVHSSAICDFTKRFPDLASARKVSDHLPVYVVFTP